jgi:hypothetical protein
VRYVGEQQTPRAIRSLKLLRALLQIVRHLIEGLRKGCYLVATVLTRASGKVTGTDLSRSVLEASQPRPDRAENEESGGRCADSDKQHTNECQRRTELA